ncbi:hypothetical protein B0H10DRAFT_643636 [Mycena sp. CBHHK59/15]|nr:hypothetical protein B0H10DRAFT_643636 [Mycena sp. CBHHK59/15]
MQAVACISFVGFFGVLSVCHSHSITVSLALSPIHCTRIPSLMSPQAKCSHLRLCRNYFAVDLACFAILTALAGYYLAAHRRCGQPSSRSSSRFSLGRNPRALARACRHQPPRGPGRVDRRQATPPPCRVGALRCAPPSPRSPTRSASASCPCRPPSPRPTSSTPRCTSASAPPRVSPRPGSRPYPPGAVVSVKREWI